MNNSIILISLISLFLFANAAEAINNNDDGLDAEKSLLHLTKPSLYEEATMTFPLHSKPAIIDENDESLSKFVDSLPYNRLTSISSILKPTIISKRQWSGGFSGNSLGSLSGSMQGSHNFGNGWTAGGGFGLNNGKPTHFNVNGGYTFNNGDKINGDISLNGNGKPMGANIGASHTFGNSANFNGVNVNGGISLNGNGKPTGANIGASHTFGNGVNVNGVNLNGVNVNGGINLNGNGKPVGAQIGVSIPIKGKREAEEVDQLNNDEIMQAERVFRPNNIAIKPNQIKPMPNVISNGQGIKTGGQIGGGLNWQAGSKPNVNIKGDYTFKSGVKVNGGVSTTGFKPTGGHVGVSIPIKG